MLNQVLNFWSLEELRSLVHRTGTALIVFLSFWIAGKIVHAIVRRLTAQSVANADLIDLLGRIAKLSLYTFGLITGLGTAGIDVSALVAGLGLTGFALGFAFRDVLSNLLAGVLILLYRPFSRGDYISVTGLEGTVVHIDLRYTCLDNTGKTILIPNSNLFTNPIIVTKPAEPGGSVPG